MGLTQNKKVENTRTLCMDLNSNWFWNRFPDHLAKADPVQAVSMQEWVEVIHLGLAALCASWWLAHVCLSVWALSCLTTPCRPPLRLRCILSASCLGPAPATSCRKDEATIMLANNCSFFNLFGVTIAKLLYHQPIQSSNNLAKQKQSTQFILISPLPLT